MDGRKKNRWALNWGSRAAQKQYFGCYGWLYDFEFLELAKRELDAYFARERIKMAAFKMAEWRTNKFRYQTNVKSK